MHISIINNDCIINRDHISPLGKITCDVLNSTGWDKYKHLMAFVDFFIPLEDGCSALEFYDQIDEMRTEIAGFRKELAEDGFYALSDEVENTFYAVEELFNSIYKHTDKLMDEGVKKLYPDDFDEFAWRNACDSITSFYCVHADAVHFFTKFIDQVIIGSEKYAHLSPLERLAISNHDAIKNKLNDVVHYSQTSSTGVHAPDYELITLSDGSYQIAQVISINNVAQFMYHEIMQLLMRGHSIRRCKNCGKFFVQYGDRIVEYCDNIPEGETKPCSVIGPSRQFTASLKEDPIKLTYTRVYKKYVARRRAQTITPEQFARWSAEAKELRAKAYETSISEGAFQTQLDDLMNRIVAGE